MRCNNLARLSRTLCPRVVRRHISIFLRVQRATAMAALRFRLCENSLTAPGTFYPQHVAGRERLDATARNSAHAPCSVDKTKIFSTKREGAIKWDWKS